MQGDWSFEIILGIFLVGVLCFVIVIVRAARQYKADTAHLAIHGIHTTARVIGLSYHPGTGNHGRCPVHLILQWRDPRSGNLVQLTSCSFTLERKATFDNAGVTRKNASTRIHLLGDWPVHLDPAEPKRYHRIGELERARQVLQGEI